MPHHLRPLLAACLATLATASQAVPLAADGAWNTFDVDSLSAASGDLEWIDLFDGGAALGFEFVVPTGHQGLLTVVDGGFAGDRFLVTDGNVLLGRTSVPGLSYPDSIGLDFDAALADSRYSQGIFTLGAGSHSVSGFLIRSVTVGDVPLNATVGAVRLEVSAVPEPATLALLLAGFGVLAFAARRRAP